MDTGQYDGNSAGTHRPAGTGELPAISKMAGVLRRREPDGRRAHCQDMATCTDPRDWTVLRTGHGTGSVTCGEFRGWYARNSHGHIQITWTGGPEDGAPPEVHRAATAACEAADDGRQTSKAGRLDAGG